MGGFVGKSVSARDYRLITAPVFQGMSSILPVVAAPYEVLKFPGNGTRGRHPKATFRFL